MKLLLKVARENRRHYMLLIITLVASAFLTFASQLEMFTMGFLVNTGMNKGSNFFELFAPEKNGQVEEVNTISYDQVKNKWDQIDTAHTGEITGQQATSYVASKQRFNLHGKIMYRVEEMFHLSSNITRLLVVFIFVALFKVIAAFCGRYTMTLVGIRVSRDLRQKYFEHIQSLPMSFYQKYHIGSLSARVSGDAGTVAGAISSFITNYFQSPFTIVTSLGLLFYLSWKLSLLIFIGLPLLVIPILYLAKRVKQISKQIQQNSEKFATVLIDFLAGIETVKLFVMESFSLKKYKEQNDRAAKLEEKSARYGYSSRPILHMIGTFFLGLVILYGLYVAHMPLAEIVVYVGFLHLFYEPIKKFSEENIAIQKGIAAAERMFDVLSIKPDIEDHSNAIVFPPFQEKISFQNVWFRYEKDWILKGISFDVPKGSTVALVGPTGGGKSTIAKLLPRLYEIEKGDILIDNVSIRDFKQKSLRENIAFVPQKPFLFLDTVLENISFGRLFPKEQVIDAAKRAQADEFIQRLDKKYDAILAETGKNLSGGQQQRLAIARALLKVAPILVMDEATSSLDSVSEHRIKMAVDSLRGTVTQLIIAHRLSTIEDADKIIYIEGGVKIAEGTREELLKDCAGFRLMWEMLHRYEKERQHNITTIGQE